jgi:hypothetical protein
MKSYTAQELTIWKLKRLIEQKEKDGFLTASDEKELERCIFLLNHWGIEHPLVKDAGAFEKNQQEKEEEDISDKDILDTLKKKKKG